MAARVARDAELLATSGHRFFCPADAGRHVLVARLTQDGVFFGPPGVATLYRPPVLAEESQERHASGQAARSEEQGPIDFRPCLGRRIGDCSRIPARPDAVALEVEIGPTEDCPDGERRV